MIKAVIFDAIDTLFAAYPDKIGMYQRIIKEVVGLDVNYNDMETVWDRIISDTEKTAKLVAGGDNIVPIWEGFNAKILERLGYTGDDIMEKGETLRLESWTNPENFSLYPDVRPTLEKLNNEDIIIACISNEAAGLNNFFTHFDIDDYFKAIIISEDVDIEKPDKKIFELCLDRLELKPEEAIFIGDSPISDYEGAKKAGLHAILIDREDRITDNGIRKISDLKDIINIIQEKETYAATT